MIELPEAISFSKQANKLLTGKVIIDVFPPTSLHKFAFFNGDPADYKKLLVGKEILSVDGRGMYININLSDNATLSIGDGTNMRYGDTSSNIPTKYQLLIVFDDETFLYFTVAMYGMIYAFTGEFDNMYYRLSKDSISPLEKEFDRTFFEDIFNRSKKNLSVKAFLATEQRIPGLGNGVLQDILFNAQINPKRKIQTLTDKEKNTLFESVKNTLRKMTDLGGRDVQTNLLGEKGGYQTILSSATFKNPCPRCGDNIVKEAYLGGAVYYCPTCQKL